MEARDCWSCVIVEELILLKSEHYMCLRLPALPGPIFDFPYAQWK